MMTYSPKTTSTSNEVAHWMRFHDHYWLGPWAILKIQDKSIQAAVIDDYGTLQEVAKTINLPRVED